jgi:hypothetical protein
MTLGRFSESIQLPSRKPRWMSALACYRQSRITFRQIGEH